MTFVLGLTGSIGMGKSTTAAMFADAGLPVWDADAAVHRLYAPGGAAVAPMAKAFPQAVENDTVDRGRLKVIIADDPSALARIETIVHPLVAADRDAFISRHADQILVLDIPLLFEKGLDALCDAVVTVTATPEVQRARVLSRPGMTPDQFALILSRQFPDADKRARSDYVVETLTLDHARGEVDRIVDQIRQRIRNA